jgi:hypothetical protein
MWCHCNKLFAKVGEKNKFSKNKITLKIGKPSDPTIAAQFNTYRFSDYKEAVIALLGKVCRVSNSKQNPNRTEKSRRDAPLVATRASSLRDSIGLSLCFKFY